MRLSQTIAVLSLLAAACKPGELTRAEAQRLLSERQGADSTGLVTAPLNKDAYDRRCSDIREGEMPVWDEMRARGFIALRDSTYRGTFLSGEFCVASLTEKGEAAAREGWRWVEEPQLVGPKLRRWQVPVGRVAITEVTGLAPTPNDPTTASAEYAWRQQYDQLGEAIGRRVTAAGGTFVPRQGTGTATFKRFDDGWRVTRTSLRADRPR